MTALPGRIHNCRSLQGWPFRTPKDSGDTLNFCALTGIRSMIEDFTLDDAVRGYQRMITNTACLRAVPVNG